MPAVLHRNDGSPSMITLPAQHTAAIPITAKMGIPHLYTHLRPYAHPETFPPTSLEPTPLFIDGPGLAHHVYQMALCATPLVAASPWDTALGYKKFQAALIRYLDELSAAQLHIRKIYLDGHLPASKLPTRHSRVEDALRRLKSYHSMHAHSLRTSSSTASSPPAFTQAATYTPRTLPLSAPPFILAATIEALYAHETYRSAVATIPGEAESYCARDAMTAGGLVLTGDSDLLMFTAAAGEDQREWGIIMFRDVTLAFPGVVGVVFRPLRMAATLGVDLTFLGYLASADSHATFSALQQRVRRIEERKRSGVAVGEYGKGWREFKAVYELPAENEVGIRGVEPRIAELLNGGTDETMTFFLPFLWEDPARGSAWDVGKRVRASAYSLLGREGVSEVCRRGQRITDAFVHSQDPAEVLDRVNSSSNVHGDSEWWVRAILEDIVCVYEDRGQTPPEKSLLESIAYMLSLPPQTAVPAMPFSRKWTWDKVQIFAMAQAAWYSLLVLKEVLTASGGDDCKDRLEPFPGVAECIDGSRFLEGASLADDKEKKLVRDVMAAYYARIRKVDEDLDTENGNGKRSSSQEPQTGIQSKKKKKKQSKDKKKKRSKDKKQGESYTALDSGNIFAVLAD